VVTAIDRLLRQVIGSATLDERFPPPTLSGIP
jgi:hypothetical protein